MDIKNVVITLLRSSVVKENTLANMLCLKTAFKGFGNKTS